MLLSQSPAGLPFGFSFSALLLLVTRGRRGGKTALLLRACADTPEARCPSCCPRNDLPFAPAHTRFTRRPSSPNSPPGPSHPRHYPQILQKLQIFLPPVARTRLPSLGMSTSAVRHRANARPSEKPASSDSKSIQHGSSYQVSRRRSICRWPPNASPSSYLLVSTLWLFA